MNAIHFGAGSIGRGFIGDLLHNDGYAIAFVDVNTELNKQINHDNGYDLYIIEKGYEKKSIDRCTAWSPLTDREKIRALFVEADIITTSVWADNLAKIAPVILDGLKERRHRHKARINIITCENALFNGDMLRRAVLDLDNSLTAPALDALACFPNTAVDRMVLNSRRDGKDTVDIGVEYELVIERSRLADPEKPPITGAVYTAGLQQYLERKLYVINGGHAWAGYMGYVLGYDIIQDVFADDTQVLAVKNAMGEAADLLSHKYDFSRDDLDRYIDFAINRFKTPGIRDTISRVCRSPIRKLSPNDRLVGPCAQCEAAGLENSALLAGIAAAFLFENPMDEQCNELQAAIQQQGIGKAVTRYTGIGDASRMHREIVQCYARLKEIKNTHR
ncbi:hypothetical protein [Acerihabitans sp.]|uniref:mannitol dehydrogenase family protein n=1 Tax=Acerihabitans sp. TaxID=2811394 RepID=UPI002EDADB19